MVMSSNPSQPSRTSKIIVPSTLLYFTSPNQILLYKNFLCGQNKKFIEDV